MNHTMRIPFLASLVLVSLSLSVPTQAQQTPMTFFVTSIGPGNGADRTAIGVCLVHECLLVSTQWASRPHSRATACESHHTTTAGQAATGRGA